MKKTANPLPPEQTKWFLENPQKFNIDKLEANEMRQGSGAQPIVKIPRDRDRIRMTMDEHNQGSIELVIGRETDPETGEIREETVRIGTSISGHLPGMMIASEVYHDYYDIYGNLRNDPLKETENTPDERREAAPEDEANVPPGKNGTVGACPQVSQSENGTDGACPKVSRLRNRIAEELRKKNNLVRLGDTMLVRLPEIPGRIRVLEPNSKGFQQVQYIYKQWYDAEKQQSRNRKAIIGQISDEYEKAIVPNVNYECYFNIDTGEPWKENQEPGGKWMEDLQKNVEEFRRKQEEEKRRKEEDERLRELYGENSPEEIELAHQRLAKIVGRIRAEDDDSDMDDEEILDESTENSGNETGPDLPDKENTDNGEEEDLQTLYSRVSKERERQAILSHILEGVTNSISNRAKKRPDDLINSYKANKINALLIEIRVKYQNTGYEDLLELIQEPQEVEEDGRKYVIGMTYSDVEILLNHYSTVLRHIRIQE